MKTEKKRQYLLFPFAVFALFLGLQAVPVFSIPLFGDDYYYATFVGSFEHFVSENILHYKEVNGRALVHLFDEILLADRSLTVFGIFDLLAIGAVVFFSAAIGARCFRYGFFTRRFAVALPTACLLFSVLSLETLRTTVYWATGAVNYLFPLALLFVFTYYMLGALTRKSMGRTAAVLLPLLAFLIGESIEQASAAVCAVSLFAVWQAAKAPKESRGHLFGGSVASLVCGAVGFFVLFLAPGNAVRETYYPEFYAKPLFERILGNVKSVVNYNIGQWSGAAYTVPVLLLVSGYALLLAHRAHLWQRILMCFAFPTAIVASGFLIALESSDAEEIGVWMFYAACYGFVLLSCFAVFLADFLSHRTHLAAAFVLLAVLLQLPMLLSPEIGVRTCLCSFLLVGVAAIAGAAELAEIAGTLRATRILSAVFCVAAVVWMTARGTDVAVRYRRNVATYRQNELEVEKWLEKGDVAEPLLFLMPPENLYRYTLPFDNPYHATVYKRLYGIPDEVVLKYDFLNE